MIPPLPSLLLITDRRVAPDLLGSVASALKGGVTHLLLRDKGTPAGALTLLAQEMMALIQPLEARFLLIHDRVDVALAVDAAGVHLPENGMPTADARRLLHRGASAFPKLVGRSCHSVASARQALAEGADYVTLSPLFASRSHPETPPLGIQRFAAMRAAIPGPVLALGGITAHNVADALRSGADGVALIRGILNTPSPSHTAATMIAHMTHGRQQEDESLAHRTGRGDNMP